VPFSLLHLVGKGSGVTSCRLSMRPPTSTLQQLKHVFTKFATSIKFLISNNLLMITLDTKHFFCHMNHVGKPNIIICAEFKYVVNFFL